MNQTLAEIVLKEHNKFRNRVAKGKYAGKYGLRKAARMTTMVVFFASILSSIVKEWFCKDFLMQSARSICFFIFHYKQWDMGLERIADMLTLSCLSADVSLAQRRNYGASILASLLKLANYCQLSGRKVYPHIRKDKCNFNASLYQLNIRTRHTILKYSLKAVFLRKSTLLNGR